MTAVASLAAPIVWASKSVNDWAWRLWRWSGRHASEGDGDFRATVIHEERDAEVDVVFVHGLGTKSTEAWEAPDHAFCWPRTQLPLDATRRLRIITYDYDSTFWSLEFVTNRTLLHKAGILIQRLAALRKGRAAQRPIVFVCHGLGGLLVKNALVVASDSAGDLHHVYRSTAGVVFLATPHSGCPTDVASAIAAVLKKVASSALNQEELEDRTKSLAYVLERFKPLAANLDIHDFQESGSVSETELTSSSAHPSAQTVPRPGSNHAKPQQDAEIIRPIHKRSQTWRDFDHICKFSGPGDEVLEKIIQTINQITERAVASTPRRGEREATSLTFRHTATPVSEIKFWPDDRFSETPYDGVAQLQQYLDKWPTNGTEVTSRDEKRLEELLPIVTLQGPAGSGKSQAALEYIESNEWKYGSVLWIAATNRKSLEKGFRRAAREIAKHLGSDAAKQAQLTLGLDGQDLESAKELSDPKLGCLIQGVTEWLEQPHEKKWLLVLDDLSHDSSYPLPLSLIDWTHSRRAPLPSWRKLLRSIPCVSGHRGHVIITTKLDQELACTHTIEFDGVMGGGAESSRATNRTDEHIPRIQDWLDKAQEEDRRLFPIYLFLSDQDCPWVCGNLIHHSKAQDNSALTISAKHYRKHSVFDGDKEMRNRESGFVLDRGPSILPRLGRTQELMESAYNAWETVSSTLSSLGSGAPPNSSLWEIEDEIVQNCGVAFRRCENLIQRKALKQDFLLQWDLHWGALELTCEDHSAYSTAVNFHRLVEAAVSTQKVLEGEPAPQTGRQRTRQPDRQQPAEAWPSYASMLGQYVRTNATTERPAMIAARRECAQVSALRGRFDKAADEASQVLGLEDVFGADVGDARLSGTVRELIAYLGRAGNWLAAAALLQRELAAAEREAGPEPDLHPVTVSLREALAAAEQLHGNLVQAEVHFDHAYRAQTRRLGPSHPRTMLTHCRLAAVLDCRGNSDKALKIYASHLNDLDKTLGAANPVVFGVRENLALCLMGRGELLKAEKHLFLLEAILKNYPRLYTAAILHRIEGHLTHIRSGDARLATAASSWRSTLDMEDFLDEDDAVADDDSRADFSDHEPIELDTVIRDTHLRVVEDFTGKGQGKDRK
ncbi:hypothetical protein B0T24DRAFT_630747 [Lasiosphaeria ovina]|uniref:GPI inositol-deacylase n=1 Tax=Lasiosphaeria ovina TaxID=92902 RepID=A0AAE0K2G1_9PEZI|nr:hypothetical protein B0T24DRAFT_630747 [Lasiosphaeria ovina]